MVVKHSGKKIVCRSDSVEVTREVEIYVLHRNYLRVSAACRTALDSENGTERGLAECYGYGFADALHSVGKTYGCGSLALACGGRRYGGYQNKLTLGACALIQERVVDLCFIVSVIFEIFFINTDGFCNLADMLHFCALRNFNI